STSAGPSDPAGRSLPTPTSTFVPLVSGQVQATTPICELDHGPPGQGAGRAQGQQGVEDVGRDPEAEPPVGTRDRQRDNGPTPGPGPPAPLGPRPPRTGGGG